METTTDLGLSIRKIINITFSDTLRRSDDNFEAEVERSIMHHIQTKDAKRRRMKSNLDTLSLEDCHQLWDAAKKTNKMNEIRDCFIKTTQELFLCFSHDTLTETDKATILNFLCERGAMQMSVSSEVVTANKDHEITPVNVTSSAVETNENPPLVENDVWPYSIRQEPVLVREHSQTENTSVSTNDNSLHKQITDQQMYMKAEILPVNQNPASPLSPNDICVSVDGSAPSVVHHDNETFSIVPETELLSPGGASHTRSTDAIHPIKISTQSNPPMKLSKNIQPVKLKIDRKQLLKYDGMRKRLKSKIKFRNPDKSMKTTISENSRQLLVDDTPYGQCEPRSEGRVVDDQVQFEESVSYSHQSSLNSGGAGHISSDIQIKSEGQAQCQQVTEIISTDINHNPGIFTSELVPERALDTFYEERRPYCDGAINQSAHEQNIAIHHPDDTRYLCSLCDVHFSCYSDLAAHRKTHTRGVRHPCQICQKTFSTKRNLVVHLSIHTGVRPFQCEICKKRFITRDKLNIHTRIHTGEKPHHCHYCGKRFNTKSNYNTHMRIHTGVNIHTCTECGAQYSRKSILIKHMKKHVI